MTRADAPSLTLTRQLKAPIDRVFRAWTDGSALQRWFGPSDAMSVPAAEVDLHVGGRFRIILEETSGARHSVGGVYHVIETNRKLVFTWAWESTPERESLVTLTFEAIDSGTRLTLRHEQFADEPARDRHRDGWSGSFERLERHLTNAP